MKTLRGRGARRQHAMGDMMAVLMTAALFHAMRWFCVR